MELSDRNASSTLGFRITFKIPNLLFSGYSRHHCFIPKFKIEGYFHPPHPNSQPDKSRIETKSVASISARSRIAGRYDLGCFFFFCFILPSHIVLLILFRLLEMSSSENDSKFKYFGILLLTLQQASMPLMARYSRAREDSNVFFTTVNVFMMEIIKVTVCSAIIIYNQSSVFKYVAELKTAIVDNRSETLKVCVPALIYTLQNNLYYIALSHLEATTFCITYQMKIFTTAIFMYFFLGKKLSTKQWWALILLVLGVADIQYIYSPPPASESLEQNPMYGFGAVLTMCFTSAFAGVYLEKVLKSSNASIWVQNIRLALIGLPISFFSMWYYDWDKINEQGFFRGWDFIVICMTVTNSVGGILISVVIKYADNILKAYAQSMAIIGAAVGSWILFDFAPGLLFLLGTAMVIVSIIVYTAFPYQEPESKLSSYLKSQESASLLMIRPAKY